MELMKVARATVDEFAEIPASAKDEVVQDLVDGLESIFQDYISFVASCGTKFFFPLAEFTLLFRRWNLHS
jgi:hypothetical protein